MTIILENNIYVMEVKLVDKAPAEGAANAALAQIQQRNYAQKYRGQKDAHIFELGLVFGKEERNLVQYDWHKHEIGAVGEPR